MAIADDIAAVRNGGGTDAEKARAIRVIKCQSMYAELTAPGVYRQSFIYDNKNWMVWDVWLEEGATILALTFDCTGRGAQAGVTYMRRQRVHRFINPPPLAADGSDNRIQAAKELLAGLL